MIDPFTRRHEPLSDTDLKFLLELSRREPATCMAISETLGLDDRESVGVVARLMGKGLIAEDWLYGPPKLDPYASCNLILTPRGDERVSISTTPSTVRFESRPVPHRGRPRRTPPQA